MVGIGSNPTIEFRTGVQIQCLLDNKFTPKPINYHLKTLSVLSDRALLFNNISLISLDYLLLYFILNIPFSLGISLLISHLQLNTSIAELI